MSNYLTHAQVVALKIDPLEELLIPYLRREILCALLYRKENINFKYFQQDFVEVMSGFYLFMWLVYIHKNSTKFIVVIF